MNDLEREARRWKDLGIATIPIHYKSKTPNVRSWQEYTERLPEDREIERWYTNPYQNIGIITGWRSLCILDFDEADVYMSWLNWARGNSSIAQVIAGTTKINMSARGVHVYLYTRQPATNMKLEKLDVLCQRKYALIPPSIHPSGQQYRVLQDLTPARVERIEDVIPPAWIEKAREIEMRQAAEQAAVRAANDTIYTECWDMQPDTVRKIKNHYRIENFFPDAQPSGNGWCKVKCPLHDDRHPSAGINIDQQIFVCFNHCYGSKPLDVIGLYARLHGLSNSEAISELAKTL